MKFLISGNSDIQWCFSQVKGTLDDDVTEGEEMENVDDIEYVEKNGHPYYATVIFLNRERFVNLC